MAFAVLPAGPAIPVFLVPARPRGAGVITDMKVSPMRRVSSEALRQMFSLGVRGQEARSQPLSSSSKPWAAAPRQQAEAATLLPNRRNSTVAEIISLQRSIPCHAERRCPAARETFLGGRQTTEWQQMSDSPQQSIMSSFEASIVRSRSLSPPPL